MLPIRISGPFVALAVLLAGSISAGAADDPPPASPNAEAWMSEADIKGALGGQAIDGHYRNGRTFSETYAADGHISYRDDYRSSGGHWSLINGAFCTIYDSDPSGGCYRVKRSGTNCFEFYFVARTEDEANSPRKPDWTARGWRRDAKSTCVDAANA